MPKVALGTLESVDVWDVWKDEPFDFTPWLSENLDLLGEEIGFSLDLVDTEVYVDKFKLDILAESEGIGLVAIENQLTWSDNKHLGQLLTYASGLDVRGVVWVARKFEPAHLNAIDWLNRWTPSELGFYAVEVGAVRIEGTEGVAPIFSAVVEPLEFVNQSTSDPLKAAVAQFHADLLGEVRALIPNAEESKNGGVWVPLDLPFPFIGFTLRMTPKQGTSVHLYFESGQPAFTQAVFDSLSEHRRVIEEKFGQPLKWTPFKYGGRVRLTGTGSPNDSPELLAALRKELISTYQALHAAIGPYLPGSIQQAQAILDADLAASDSDQSSGS